MGDLAEVIAPAGHTDATRPRPEHPKGWEPGVTIDADGTGTATVALDNDEDLAGVEPLLRAMLPDVDDLSLLRVTQVRAWDSGDRICRYVRCDVQAAPVTLTDADLRAMIEQARNRSNVTRRAEATSDPLVVCLSDWQFGKADGDGLPGLLDRLTRLEEQLAAEVKARRPSVLYLAGLGDLVEGCDGNYAMQTFSVELDRRSQVRAARRILWRLIDRLSRLVETVVVLCVPGNHGENRQDGKAHTTFGDNDDVAVFEMCAEIAAANPDRYGGVSFVIPDNDLTITVDVAGTVVGFAHGHQAKRGGSTPQQKLQRWREKMADQRHPIGDADVVVSAHYHHLQLVEDGPKTWMQCPALDGGSQWWQESGGAATKAGTLTFRVGPDGWHSLKVLR